MRKLATLVTICAGALAATAPGAVAAGGEGCQVSGQMTGSPSATLAVFGGSTTLHGTLSGCQGAPGAPASGTFSAGEPVTINGVAYKAPPPATGTMSCQFASGGTTAIAQWNGGAITVFSFSAGGSWIAGQEYNGSVQPSIDLTRVQPNPATGKPVVDTIRTTAYAGGTMYGATSVSGADVAACNGAGLKSVNFSGAFAFYSTS